MSAELQHTRHRHRHTQKQIDAHRRHKERVPENVTAKIGITMYGSNLEKAVTVALSDGTKDSQAITDQRSKAIAALADKGTRGQRAPAVPSGAGMGFLPRTPRRLIVISGLGSGSGSSLYVLGS